MFRDKNKINNRKGGGKYISKKTYENPYFQSAKKTSVRSSSPLFSWKKKIFTFLFLFFIISLCWFILYSKYFLIYDIEINIEKVNDIGGIEKSEIEKITREQLRSKYIFLPGNNIFLFNEERLYNSLDTNLAFEKIEIRKKLPNKLFIDIKEVSYALIWKENDLLYYITTNGEIISTVSEEDVKAIFPLIQNRGQDLIESGRIINKEEHLKIAVLLYKDFNDANIFNIEKFTLGDQNDNTLTMKIFEGPEVYFSTIGDLQPQKEKLVILRDEKLKNDLYSKMYIDLRYGDMIYYR